MNSMFKRRKLFMFAIASILMATLVAIGNGQTKEETDLTETFGRHLNIYHINLERKPHGFEDFESFQLMEFANQDVDDPGLDSRGRSQVDGSLRLADGTVFPIRFAFLQLNRDRKYEWLSFETKELNGEKFKFRGRFLQKRVTDRPFIDTYLHGVLTREKRGTKPLSKDMPFTIFADE